MGDRTAELLARLDAMAARLDEQATEIEGLKAQHARLASQTPPTGMAGAAGMGAPGPTRRGLLKGALAAGAAVTALASAKAAPAHAADPNDVVKGAINVTSATTTISSGSAIAFAGYSRAIGVDGVGQSGGIGLRGSSNGGGGTDFGGAGTGVEGLSGSGYGVYGRSTSNMAVVGMSSTHHGVYGRSSGTGYGVLGSSESFVGVHGSGRVYGVEGHSTAPYGSPLSIGVVGYTTNAAGTGVHGRSSSGIGIHGEVATSMPLGGLAGRFDGPVVVNGAFTVVGGPKSAAVPHPDGDYRRMYCQEAPEPWFEDFGTGTLQNGRAVVDLDPEFDAVVKGDDYLVFPVPEGDCNGLFISRKGPHRFVVEELKGGKSTLPFSYRVVSRRRDEVGKRLERIKAADIHKGKDRPAPPEPVKVPDVPPITEPR